MIAPWLLAAALAGAPLTPGAGQGASPPPTSPEPQAGGYAVSIASVFVRRTPSLPGPVIDEEKADTLFKIVSCQGGWCALDLGPRGGVGYLPANALHAVPSPR